MAKREFLLVDPQSLHLPHSRQGGADPAKLQRQIARYGRSSEGMPPVWVNRGSDGELAIVNGVTRATRLAKLSPGTVIPVEVIAEVKHKFATWPRIGERLP